MTKKILVVDDEAEIRSGYRDLLELSGYQVAEASDGREALAAYDTFNPDAVLTDLNMPRLDGLGLAIELRKKKFEGPIVIASGRGIDDEMLAKYGMRREDVSQVVTDVLTKPFEFGEFLKYLK